MARLFITPREVDFISDLTKEINKDVIGQKIFYYRVREDLTNSHEVYEEAIDKVFDPPVEIAARVDWDASAVSTNRFGSLIFGQVEYKTGIRIFGKQARKGAINFNPIGPTDEGDKEINKEAIQETFVQQRGIPSNSEGETGDIRALEEQGKTERIIDKPAEVSPKGDDSSISSSFYGDEDEY